MKLHPHPALRTDLPRQGGGKSEAGEKNRKLPSPLMGEGQDGGEVKPAPLLNIQHILLTIIFLSHLFLTACSPFGLALTAGSAAAVVVAQRRSVADAATDARIHLEVDEKIFQTDLTLFGKATVSVIEGRVLITGAIREAAFIDQVSEIAWRVNGVHEVYNELKVFRGDPSVDFGQDTLIYGKVRTAMLRDRVIDEINYTIDVSRGIVYLMGIARDQNEINRALDYVHDIRGVRGVVNYIITADDPRRKHL